MFGGLGDVLGAGVFVEVGQDEGRPAQFEYLFSQWRFQDVLVAVDDQGDAVVGCEACR